jgi:hypothetical protein
MSSGAPAGSPNTPTLDVILQGSMDDGATWFDVITFTQATTTAAVERKTAIASSTQVLGSMFRVKHSVGTASGTATYSVTVSVRFL